MESLHGEASEVAPSTTRPEYDDDIPMSAFLATPHEFRFRNGKRHVDLNVWEKIPLKFLTMIAGTEKAEVKTVDCRDLGYTRNLVCKIMKTAPKGKYMMEPPDLQKLRHVHIVAFVATFTYNHRDYALMYPHAKTDLGTYMEPVSNWLRGEIFCDSHTPLVSKVQELDLSLSAPTRIDHLRNFFPCLAGALDYLHKQNVKHKDIKPANILVDRFNSPILADFDLSHRYTDPNEALTTGPTGYTYLYAAPETVRYGERPFPSDSFSLACVFSEMVTLVMGQNLQAFRKHRTLANRDAAFHTCIDATQAWLRALYDPTSTRLLREANENTQRFVPVEGYHHEQVFITAVETICKMLDYNPGNRPPVHKLSRLFRPIATRQCRECTEQTVADQALSRTVTAAGTAGGSAPDLNVPVAVEPSHRPTHLAPPPLPRLGESSGSSGSHNTPVDIAQAVLETTRTERRRPSGRTPARVGQRSISADQSPCSPMRSTEISEWTPLPPVTPSVSPAQSSASSSEVAQPANGEVNDSGTLSQRQKLREAIGYDVQNRLWKIRKRSDLEKLEGVWVTIKPFRTKVKLKAQTGEPIAKAPLAGLPVLAYLRCYFGRVREVYAIGRPDRPRSPSQRRP